VVNWCKIKRRTLELRVSIKQGKHSIRRTMSLVTNKVRLPKKKKKPAKIALTFKRGETQKNHQI
jgi:hypothetical protein